jgi:hypothetical protein
VRFGISILGSGRHLPARAGAFAAAIGIAPQLCRAPISREQHHPSHPICEQLFHGAREEIFGEASETCIF